MVRPPKIVVTGGVARLMLHRVLFTLCCLGLTAVLLLCAVVASALQAGQGAKAAALQTVIVDAGHGGFDGGAVVGEVVEKNINLAIALYLRDMLKLSGYEVIMTREADCSTEGEVTGSIATRKKADMRNRLQLMRQNPQAVFVSIHLNKFESSGVCGAQIFYAKGVPRSMLLAQKIMQQVVAQTQPENKRAIKPNQSSTFILQNAPIPAVIAECGFMSNPAELARLQSAEYQKKLAFAVLSGVMAYFAEGKEEV